MHWLRCLSVIFLLLGFGQEFVCKVDRSRKSMFQTVNLGGFRGVSLGFGNVLIRSGLPKVLISTLIQAKCEENIQYKLLRTPNDAYWNELKPIYDSVEVTKFLNTRGLRRIYVAVLDTGVDFLHEDMQGKVDLGLAFNAYNFVNELDPEEIYDSEGHGTHVSGIIAARGYNQLGTIGVAQNATVIPIKVDNPDGQIELAAVVAGYA
ncbi:MAG: S8 family serine peptidase, partial [Deltaproteobacteria bacterium]|nr:S8 family serine peptidase [Deltaproteobacteria bacterium]